MKAEPVLWYGGQKLRLRQVLQRNNTSDKITNNKSWTFLSTRQRHRYKVAARNAVLLAAANVSSINVVNEVTVDSVSAQLHSNGGNGDCALTNYCGNPNVTIDSSHEIEPTTQPQPQTSRVENGSAPIVLENESSAVPFLTILRLWAVMCQIPATQMDLLLRLLRKNHVYHEFLELPKNWKSVVRIEKKMQTKYVVEEWGTANERKRFAYVGIEQQLLRYRHLYIPEGSRGE